MKKLKTTVCGMYIKRKLKSDSASMNATLSYVLKNGCKKFPTLTEINRELQSLYGATLNSGVIKNGDNHVIFFDAETISDKYAPNGENLVLGLVEMLMNAFKLAISFKMLCTITYGDTSSPSTSV